MDAGWSSLVARRAHNPKVVGSNPAPATNLFRQHDKFMFVRNATLAQLVERNLAKVEVTSSNLVCRSSLKSKIYRNHTYMDAGWSSLVARRAHNPKVVGSNPAPATNLF